MQDEKAYSFDIINLLKTIFKWKWQILLVVAIAAISTLIFSGPSFITPKFKASVILYPTASSSISGSVLSSNPSFRERGILEFGEKEQAEQLMQILQSDEIKLKVINRFNLFEHYKVDTASPIKYTYVKTKFKKNFSFERTEFMAIEITVMDESAQLASDMANYLATELDSIKNNIQNDRAKNAYSILKRQYASKKQTMDSIQRELDVLRSRGMYDYFSQSGQINQKFLDASQTFNQESGKLETFSKNRADIQKSISEINQKLREYRKKGIFNYDDQSADLNESYTLAQGNLQLETGKLKSYEKSNLPASDSIVVRTKARIDGYQEVLKTLEPRLNTLANEGGDFVMYQSQLEIEMARLRELKLSEDLSKVRFTAAAEEMNSLRPQIENIKRYGGEYVNFVNNLELERKNLMTLKTLYDNATVDFEQKIPQKFIVNSATRPEVKIFPVRSLMVVIAAIGAFFLSVVVILFVEFALPSFNKR